MRAKAANDHSDTPSTQTCEATAVSHTSKMQAVSDGGREGMGADACVKQGKHARLWFKEVTQAPAL